MNDILRESTGLLGLDEAIDYLRIGDNVVWQIDELAEYIQFAQHFVHTALEQGRRVVYIRFAQHMPIIKDTCNIQVYEVEPNEGFESFSTRIHELIRKEGEGVYYIFDCLSNLLSAWATDLMIGNFFRITCPYLYELNTIAYFGIRRNYHSFQTIARIRETTQILLDVYNVGDHIYVHPVKVWNRYSPSMFLPHIQRQNEFIPITSSIEATQVFSFNSKKGLQSEERQLDYWDRLFLEAAVVNEEAKKGSTEAKIQSEEMIEKLCRLMIGKEEKILSLARKYFSLEDLLQFKTRMIGTGFVGGKTVGMLLARSILLQEKEVDWNTHLEPHDSFYIGSDVFYTYIVQNGWWKKRMQQKTKEGYFTVAAQLKEKMLTGRFPDPIKEQFQCMLEYFGQSPIIVRSSSLLEDAFGNAFAGKYESIFCVNQGTPEERYNQFEQAVRKIYVSTMSEDALAYRLQRGLDQSDEQMALLVQRVSGAYHGQYYFPYLAGVGNSYNSYVWKEEMDVNAGMLRLVAGLGTRAVDRVEGDYPRLVSLDYPLLQPVGNLEERRRFSQHEIDVLNIAQNTWQTLPISTLLEQVVDLDMDLIGMRDHSTIQRMKELGIKHSAVWILTFDPLLSQTPFASQMQKILKVLEKHYQYPVDVEFTANFLRDGEIAINIVQCRPQQTYTHQVAVEIPKYIPKEQILFSSEGNFMGGNILVKISKIIYVDPQLYSQLKITQKYEVARTIGRLNSEIGDQEKTPTLLLGPGRWGTSTPSLGVPVTFSEINHIAVLGEVEFAAAGFVPELSYGTHFFQDLVENKTFYVALFTERENVVLNTRWLSDRDCITKGIVRIYDVEEENLQLISDIGSQRVVCYVHTSDKE